MIDEIGQSRVVKLRLADLESVEESLFIFEDGSVFLFLTI